MPQKLPFTVRSRYFLALFSRRVSAIHLKVHPPAVRRVGRVYCRSISNLDYPLNALEFLLFYIGGY